MGGILGGGDMGVRGQFLRAAALHAELNERQETATSCYSAGVEFLQYIDLLLVAKNHQKIRLMYLIHEYSFTDVFNGIIATKQLY